MRRKLRKICFLASLVVLLNILLGIRTMKVVSEEVKISSINGILFEDTNRNKIKDTDEEGIGGVKLILHDPYHKEKSEEITTNSDGSYSFGNLTEKNYHIKISAPIGIKGFTVPDVDAKTMETSNIFVSPGTNKKCDIGMYRDTNINGIVWHDKNVNGLQDEGEVGIKEVSVRWFEGDEFLAETKTDENGRFNFSYYRKDNNLYTPQLNKNYHLEFQSPNGYFITKQFTGNNSEIDSDADISGKSNNFVLKAGETQVSIDAGYYKQSTLKGKVWYDEDNDNIMDSSEYLKNAVVAIVGGEDNISKDQHTDSDGNFVFSGIREGNYKIQVSLNRYVTYSTDEYLNYGETRNIDIRMVKTCSIGDTVWLDLNNNGIQDTEEDGLADVKVNLLDKENNVLETTNTDTSGKYNFSNLYPGDYKIKFEAGKGYKPASTIISNFGITAMNSSSVDTIKQVSLKSGDNNLDVDAGFIITPGISLEASVYKGKYDINTLGSSEIAAEDGQDVTYIFKVTNTGDSCLKNIVISGDELGISMDNLKAASVKEVLEPNDSVTYYYETKANKDINGSITASGSVYDFSGKQLAKIENPQSIDSIKVMVSKAESKPEPPTAIPDNSPTESPSTPDNSQIELPKTVSLTIKLSKISGSSAAGAAASLKDGEILIGSATSDSNGNILFSDISPGKTYKVLVSHNNFEDIEQDVVLEEQDKIISLTLVRKQNSLPVVSDYSKNTMQNTTFSDKVQAISPIEGYDLSFSKDLDPTNGQVVVNSDGSYTYTPSRGFVGTDSFRIRVDDKDDGTAYCTVTITVLRNIVSIPASSQGSSEAVSENNEAVPVISRPLRDPYGIVTDSINGKPLKSAEVTIYYAATERNKAAGIIPDSLVKLDKITGFGPSENNNPQLTDSTGKYAFMVYPNTDYYIIIKKRGYREYKSSVISVNEDAVKKDIQLKPEKLVQKSTGVSASLFIFIGTASVITGIFTTVKRNKAAK